MAVRATGKITRLYTNRHGTFVRLDIPPETAPKEEYFKLSKDHANYSGLYSLALAAAANRWSITVRIEGDGQIDPNQDAYVSYFNVDWKAQSTHTD